MKWQLIILFLLVIGMVEAKTTYTQTTKDECNNGKCNMVIYNSPRFIEEDRTWKPIEEAKSLKGLYNIQISEDKDFPVTVVDYNYTSITITIDTVAKNFMQDIPLKVYSNNDKAISFYDTTEKFLLTIPKETTINIGESILGKEIKWGFNSSTIIVNVSLGNSGFITTNAGCATPTTATLGDLSDWYVGNQDTSTGYLSRTYMNFNTTYIRTLDITDVKLFFYLVSSTETTWNANLINCSYGTTLTTADWNPTGTTLAQSNILTGISSAGWIISNSLNRSYFNNSDAVQFMINKTRVECDADNLWTIEATNPARQAYLNVTYGECYPNLTNSTPIIYNVTICWKENNTVNTETNWTQTDQNGCGSAPETFRNYSYESCDYGFNITIITPINGTTYTTRQDNFNYFIVNKSYGLTNCWYNWNGTNTSASINNCNNITKIRNFVDFNYWQIWVKDVNNYIIHSNVSFNVSAGGTGGSCPAENNEWTYTPSSTSARKIIKDNNGANLSWIDFNNNWYITSNLYSNISNIFIKGCYKTNNMTYGSCI